MVLLRCYMSLSLRNPISQFAKNICTLRLRGTDFLTQEAFSGFGTSRSYQTARGPFGKVEQFDLHFFRNLLGETRVLTSENEDLNGYNVDWLQSLKGNGKLVLKPKTTDEVSQIMKHCNSKNLAVVPQAGNTSLSGGCLAIFDEIIISMSLMNQIDKLDEISGVLTCQSGCILHNLNEYVTGKGYTMPIELGAKESCHIGGNISTNAGGLRVVRYGNLHGSVLGVEAVLADGTVLDCMTTMKKDNTGYDLKHLFIGSEGTLGILTKVSVQCPIKSTAVNLAFLGLENYQSVLNTYQKAKRNLGEILSACEYIDRETLKCADENMNMKAPIEPHNFYMMIETYGSNMEHDEEKLTSFLQESIDEGIVANGTVASNPSHIKAFWNIREKLPDALMKDGHLVIFDFSVPLEHFEQMVIDTRGHMGSDVTRVTGFGHLGDGNIHLNVTMPKANPEVFEKLETFVYQWVADRKGSISAEHGLGFKKRKHMHHSKSPSSIEMMRKIKTIFDPKGILNPYKVLPEN